MTAETILIALIASAYRRRERSSWSDVAFTHLLAHLAWPVDLCRCRPG